MTQRPSKTLEQRPFDDAPPPNFLHSQPPPVAGRVGCTLRIPKKEFVFHNPMGPGPADHEA